MINFDRVQWPVNFIPSVSLIIFYALYRFLLGDLKYIFLLAGGIGFAFHTHFTAVFYPLIVLLCLPFFPRKRKLLLYLPLALLIFLLFLVPNIVYEIQSRGSSSGSLIKYLSTYYHGLHLVRVMQLTKDAFIEFENFLLPQVKFLKYLALPIVLIIILLKIERKKALVLDYLFILWFLVPWLVFSVYSGEISNYYFSINLPIALITVSFLTWQILEMKIIPLKILVVIFWSYFAIVNIQSFFKIHPQGLKVQKQKVLEAISRGEKIEFKQGVPESYLYYIYTRK